MFEMDSAGETFYLLLNFFIQISFSLSTTFSSHFCRVSPCPGMNCLVNNFGILRSKQQCFVACSQNSECLGVKYTITGSCDHFAVQECFTGKYCSLFNSDTQYYQKSPCSVQTLLNPCRNNGVWRQSARSCQCIDGWVGTYCDRYPYSCEELETYDYPSGKYRVILDLFRNATLLPSVTCRVQSDRSVLTFILSNSGWGGHNRTWTEYVQGYYINETDFWLGLNAIYLMNTLGHTRVTVGCYLLTFAGSEGWNSNYEFKIQGPSSGFSYLLKMDSYAIEGDLAKKYKMDDVLSSGQRYSFSSFDSDRDGSKTENCAALYGVGWWYPNCNSGVNLMGYNFKAKPGSRTVQHIDIPGIDLKIQQLADAFSHVSVFYITKF